jgi:MYXO-CTERM domain-containing protein
MAFSALWGSSPTDLYAVPSFAVTPAQGLLWHFNGTSWNAENVPTSAQLRAIYGTSASNVFVVGSGGIILRHPASLPLALPGPQGATYVPLESGQASGCAMAQRGASPWPTVPLVLALLLLFRRRQCSRGAGSPSSV